MRERMRYWLQLPPGTPRRVLAEALGGLLALLLLVLVVIPLVLLLVLLTLVFLLLVLVVPLVTAVLALALASMLWPHAASDWLATTQAFGWTLWAIVALSVDVLFVRWVFFRKGKATLRGAG